MTVDKEQAKRISKKLWSSEKIYIYITFLDNIEMSENALKLGDVKVNKQEFHRCKQSIDLNLVIQD